MTFKLFSVSIQKYFDARWNEDITTNNDSLMEFAIATHMINVFYDGRLSPANGPNPNKNLYYWFSHFDWQANILMAISFEIISNFYVSLNNGHKIVLSLFCREYQFDRN